METGKIDHMSRLMKLSSDVVQLAVRGKRDPIDVVNKLQAIIDSPIPGTRPEWMSEGEYRHEVSWWKSWLHRNHFDKEVAAKLAPSLVRALAYSIKPNFPVELQLPVPSLLARSRHAIFWREITGVRVVNPNERSWPEYQEIGNSLESVYKFEFGRMTDISLEMFEDQMKLLMKRFGAPQSQEHQCGFDLDSHEAFIVMEVNERMQDVCLAAGILMAQEGVTYEFDPIMQFWSEYGNYPLGFTEDGLFVVLCADPAKMISNDAEEVKSEDAMDHLEDF